MKIKSLITILLILSMGFFSACTNVENSASQVLDNANSVLKPQSNQVFWSTEVEEGDKNSNKN